MGWLSKSLKKLKKSIKKAVPKELSKVAPAIAAPLGLLGLGPDISKTVSSVAGALGVAVHGDDPKAKQASAAPIAAHPAAPSVAGPGQIVPPASWYEQLVQPSMVPYVAVGLAAVVVIAATRRR